MKRLLFALVFTIGLFLLAPSPANAITCSSAGGSCKEACSDFGLCSISGSCFGGWECCRGTPYCKSSCSTCGCSSTSCSGGYFALIVNGTITIDPTVDTLGGKYIATTETTTGTLASGASATQLAVLDSVIADDFSLQRDLGTDNDTTPGRTPFTTQK